jgi:hypothetical protein
MRSMSMSRSVESSIDHTRWIWGEQPKRRLVCSFGSLVQSHCHICARLIRRQDWVVWFKHTSGRTDDGAQLSKRKWEIPWHTLAGVFMWAGNEGDQRSGKRRHGRLHGGHHFGWPLYLCGRSCNNGGKHSDTVRWDEVEMFVVRADRTVVAASTVKYYSTAE